MISEMIFESKQKLFMDFDDPITSAILIDHIKGLEVMARNATYVLEGLVKMDLPPPEVLITSLQLNSIEDGWLYRLTFGSGEEGKTKFEEFRKKVGINNLTPANVIGLTVAGAIAYAAWQFAPASSEPKQSPQPINVFALIGGQFGKSEEDLMKLLESKITNVESAKQGLVKLTQPGGVATTGDIVLNGNFGGSSVVPAAYLEHVPMSYDKPEMERPFKDMDRTPVEFRAIDLDKSTGWWAVLEGVHNKRVQVQLSEDVSPGSIRTGERYLADVTVTYKSKEDKTPYRVQVRRLNSLALPAKP